MKSQLSSTRRTFLRGMAAAGALTLVRPLAWAAKSPAAFPELEASGSPGALGLAHGKAFAGRIEHNLAFYTDWLTSSHAEERPRLLALARSFLPVLREHVPAQVEEMEGIAKGARRTLDEILMLNARTDLALLQKGSKARGAGMPGCTSLAITHGSGKRAHLVLGQNWDWNPAVRGNQVVLRLAPAEGPRLVTFTEAGMLAKIGFNEHRLGVCLNFLEHASDDPDGDPGVPVHCLLRAVLQCASMEQAYKLVSWAPRSASAHFLLAQHTRPAPKMLSLEYCSDAVARLLPSHGVLVHTNHFKAPSLRPGCADQGKPSTTKRNRVAEELAISLAEEQPNPLRRAQAILGSRAEAPYAICRTGEPGSRSHTIAGILMDLTCDRLYLTAGCASDADWARRPGA